MHEGDSDDSPLKRPSGWRPILIVWEKIGPGPSTLGGLEKTRPPLHANQKKIWRHCGFALLWTAIFTTLGTLVFDKTFAGQQLKMAGYLYLSRVLAQRPAGEEVPVTVIDISALAPQRSPRPGPLVYITPRRDIQAFLKTILENPETRPAAVGVDVDFSPDALGLNDPDDPQFFEVCKYESQINKVPLYLGVGRGQGAGPEGWLGLPAYAGLAAAIGVPHGDKTYLPGRFRGADAKRVLPSMGVALGEAYAGEAPKRWWGLVHVFGDEPLDETARPASGRVHIIKTLVDYSFLDGLQSRVQAIENFPPLSKQPFSEHDKEALHGKIVLLGNNYPQGADKQILPGDKNVPGVYTHACTAATFATAPLYELQTWVRWFIDLLLASVLIGTFTWARLRLHDRGKVLKMEMGVLFTALALGVMGLAACLAHVHVMWLDFLLVAAAYLVHTVSERVWHGLRSVFTDKALIESLPPEATPGETAGQPEKETPH